MEEISLEEWWDILSNSVLEYATTRSDELTRILIKIFQRLPREDAEILLYERRVSFICPQANIARPFVVVAPMDKDKAFVEIVRWLIILESSLLDEKEDHIIYIITHELAHAYFEHTMIGPSNLEREADKQVIKWGFESELRSCGASYLYGEGVKQLQARERLKEKGR